MSSPLFFFFFPFFHLLPCFSSYHYVPYSRPIQCSSSSSSSDLNTAPATSDERRRPGGPSLPFVPLLSVRRCPDESKRACTWPDSSSLFTGLGNVRRNTRRAGWPALRTRSLSDWHDVRRKKGLTKEAFTWPGGLGFVYRTRRRPTKWRRGPLSLSLQDLTRCPTKEMAFTWSCGLDDVRRNGGEDPLSLFEIERDVRRKRWPSRGLATRVCLQDSTTSDEMAARTLSLFETERDVRRKRWPSRGLATRVCLQDSATSDEMAARTCWPATLTSYLAMSNERRAQPKKWPARGLAARVVYPVRRRQTKCDEDLLASTANTPFQTQRCPTKI